MTKMQTCVIDIDSVEKEFDSLKESLVQNKYIDSETDDLVFNFLLHCRRLIYMIWEFPEQLDTVKKLREIEAKAMEHWPTVKLDKLKTRSSK